MRANDSRWASLVVMAVAASLLLQEMVPLGLWSYFGCWAAWRLRSLVQESVFGSKPSMCGSIFLPKTAVITPLPRVPV